MNAVRAFRHENELILDLKIKKVFYTKYESLFSEHELSNED
jgi:hypothetical protein